MDEQKIRQIVKDEMNRNYMSGDPKIPPHTHDGVTNFKIKRSDAVNPIGVMGKIDFISNDTYTLYFTSPNPSRLDLYGFAFDNVATDSSVMTIGIALLSKSYYFQPLTTRTVKQGGLAYPTRQATPTAAPGAIAQCSSNLYNQDNAAFSNTFPHNNQFFIMNALRASGDCVGTLEIRNLTATSVDVIVTNLISGWKISANFIIT